MPETGNVCCLSRQRPQRNRKLSEALLLSVSDSYDIERHSILVRNSITQPVNELRKQDAH